MMLNYPNLILLNPRRKYVFGQKTVIMPTFDHHILIWSQTCVWDLISTFYSYLVYYNDKWLSMIQTMHANMIS